MITYYKLFSCGVIINYVRRSETPISLDGVSINCGEGPLLYLNYRFRLYTKIIMHATDVLHLCAK
jgi:hypothetical protein